MMESKLRMWFLLPLPSSQADILQACANVKLELTLPEEIDSLDRKENLMEVELHALEEYDETNKAHIVEDEQLKKVVEHAMKDYTVRLAERNISLIVTNSAMEVILAESRDPVYGARPIINLLKKTVATNISNMLINEKIKGSATVYIDVAADKKLSYRITQN